MKIIDLAIVIPTLNEQDYIGILLDSLGGQTVAPKEIIVVDATSKDDTETEVRKRTKLFASLLFYSIPKQTISKQRNFGASKITTKHMLFLDADMLLLKKDNLEKIWKHIKKKRPDIATCYVMPYAASKKDTLMYGTGNVISSVLRPIKPVGTTMNLYVRKKVFDELGGFDESIRVGEDFEFLSRAGKADYSFSVFMRPILYTSVRRLAYEGRVKFVKKLLRSMLFIKKYGYSKNPIPYTFGKFTKSRAKKSHQSSVN